MRKRFFPVVANVSVPRIYYTRLRQQTDDPMCLRTIQHPIVRELIPEG